MSEKIVSMLAKVGVSAELAEAREGEADVRVTPVQFEKLATLLPSTKYLKVSKGRIVACVFLPDLEQAVESNAKAPRAAANVVIKSVSMYTVETDDNTTNIVTAALWDSENRVGWITINGQDRNVTTGKAEEYYTAPEEAESEWNPERPVFVMTLDVEPTADDDSDELLLTAYGFTNLIRRVVAVRKHIL